MRELGEWRPVKKVETKKSVARQPCSHHEQPANDKTEH